jgi:hypothetical protein
MRYVAFLDILGFADLVQKLDLPELKRRLNIALQSVHLARASAVLPDGVGKPITKHFHCFSFSDTFVISSVDDSPEALVSFITGSAMLTQFLFAQGLPVRGAITYGEADFIPGTQHLVGKAVVKAHLLEKDQEWLGVVVDEPSLPFEVAKIFESAPFSPLFARWDVPLKPGPEGTRILKNALVVNWRWNLTVEKGTQSLFSPSNDMRAKAKIESTLAFAKHIRQTGRSKGGVMGKDGKPIRFRFLDGCAVGSKPPNEGLAHGDEF